MEPESISLYFTQGSSDKLYKAALFQYAEEGEGIYGGLNLWEVTFAYGRRGKPMTCGTKTKVPVAWDVAKKAYDKLVSSKLAKGYTPSQDGVSFTATANAGKKTEFLPQLLYQVDETEAIRFYNSHDGRIAVQNKHDGERRGVIMSPDEIIFANKRGLITSVQTEIHDSLKWIQKFVEGTFIIDTEDMGNHLVIFDIYDNGSNIPFEQRILAFNTIDLLIQYRKLTPLRIDIPVIPQSVLEFKALIAAAKKRKEEGIVMRVLSSINTPGESRECLRLKFYGEATVMVDSIHPTKQSVGISVKDEIGMVAVGNVTIPGKNPVMPLPGALIDVKYLHANRGGSLYQPTYKCPRLDKTEPNHINSLKYKT
jgi:bifunctional non-homologous end joining protein LigD